MEPDQLGLFPEPSPFPEGFRHQPDLLPAAEERDLAARLAELPFTAFEFGGFLGRRRVVSFGWDYDFGTGELRRAGPMPEFLLPLRDRAAAFAGAAPAELEHALVTEYGPGAAIGWHRDKAVFGTVLGVSLLGPCTFRLRRRRGAGWERVSLALEPRSAYLLQGPARSDWEHSIPAVPGLRCSVTFRTLRR